ncbi:MAG: HAMP domain-containing sensor histidine kinase [Chloroherpetonaceae bacterium]
MRTTFYGLSFRLSLLFVLSFAATTGVFFYVLLDAGERYAAEVVQKSNYSLAASIAKELKINEQTDLVEREQFQKLFNAAMMINPSICIYLVHDDGEVFTTTNHIKQKFIDVNKIKAFINQSATLPLYGDNPIEEGGRIIFSAAPLMRSNGTLHCYLYVTFKEQSSGAEMIRQSYIVTVLTRTLFIVTAVASIFAVVMIFLLTRNVKSLTRAARRIEQGDFSARATVKTKDELGELALVFNDMAGKIERSIQTLKYNDQLRRELVANIAHDLRTPLSSIEGYAEMILMKEPLLSDLEKKTYLGTILKNAKSLSRLVLSLFDLSKFEAKQVEAKKEPFSPTELAQDVVLKFQPKAEEKRIALTMSLTPDAPFICGDIALIERVLQNIIENAIQYTPEGGSVCLAVSRINDDVFFSVSDTGKGISEQELPHIYDRFYRSTTAREDVSDGFGLGLAISKKILELHDATLHVQSIENKGTTFSFSIPIFRAHADAQPKHGDSDAPIA